ncbi:hypothetical protein [Litoreibacter roseus]|uniref:Uncharacterized protein n=1 Tax=Litoreibacter roseus TaxID=2601869 RepID=A0A6N6JBU2_9RHOB|nr:hypothetical protein [Litoreibacter roseus]GFE63753.1 hypothetical protein KIN_08270 [Litoreibacter roseus]
MKRLTALAALLPGSALAHGGHAPVPEIAHGLSHVGPFVGLVIIAIAGGVILYQRWLS